MANLDVVKGEISSPARIDYTVNQSSHYADQTI
jgi:hypothetical protein